jgi:radical SAM protein with 4Fe4S-binding SPASM domain
MSRPLTRHLNIFSAGYSFLAGSILGNTYAYGMPLSAGIELTNYCNLNCPECSSGSGKMTRKRGFMDIRLFENIITELGPYLFNINLYFQGEPMLHPQFFPILEKCRGINSTLSTNGHFLSSENAEIIARSGLKNLIVSVDGMDQATYSMYRVNGDLETVKAGIKNISGAIRKNSSKLRLILQFLVNRSNEAQIEDAKKFAQEMNAILQLKSMQIINDDSFEKWLPALSKMSRYEKKGNGFVIKNNFPDRCARLWFNPVITWDGKVIPCCFDKDADYVMGDLNKEIFKKIWNSQEYRSFRKNLFSNRKMTGICRNCTSGAEFRS